MTLLSKQILWNLNGDFIRQYLDCYFAVFWKANGNESGTLVLVEKWKSRAILNSDKWNDPCWINPCLCLNSLEPCQLCNFFSCEKFRVSMTLDILSHWSALTWSTGMLFSDITLSWDLAALFVYKSQQNLTWGSEDLVLLYAKVVRDLYSVKIFLVGLSSDTRSLLQDTPTGSMY